MGTYNFQIYKIYCDTLYTSILIILLFKSKMKLLIACDSTYIHANFSALFRTQILIAERNQFIRSKVNKL